MNPELEPAAAIGALGLGPLAEALRGIDAYLVGGAARAIVAGATPAGDIDIAVESDLEPLLSGLQVSGRHERFGTATIPIDPGRHADLARTRTEVYDRPGALPEVSPAPIGADLARRDFSVNAIAIGLNPPHRVLDPYGGAADLEAGVLRVLHPGSFRDDPTRAIRGARYCARLGLEPDPETRKLLGTVDLDLISADRRDAELARLAAERDAARGFALLSEWGVLPLSPSSLVLIEAVGRASEAPELEPLSGARGDAIMLAAADPRAAGRAADLASLRPGRPSQGVAAAAGVEPAVLLLAAAGGGSWIGAYLDEWREVGLEIDGNDLIAAGVAPGPALGAALRETLDLKLDGMLEPGRERELEAALAIAGGQS